MNEKKQKGVKAGQPGEKFPEKKVADVPKFYRHNERAPEQLESEGFPRGSFTKALWSDPRHPNEARAQVRGAGEVGFDDAGLRQGEEDFDLAPGMSHYGHDADEIQTHQDAIIDKHSEGAAIFRHEPRDKESYALAPESRTITKGFKGSSGPSGNPQARRN